MDIQFADPKYVEKKKQDSGNVTYIYSDGHVKARHRKKLKTLLRLAKTIKDLRRKVAEDLEDPDRGEVAMVVALIDETYERVGNPGSAADGHFGVTTWRKKHVSFPGSKAVIKYKGKAGVDQKKTVTSKRVVSLLKGLVSQKKADDELFPEVTSADVNEYLKPFKITAKDIRGFHANEEMKKALTKAKKKGGNEKQRKEEFKQALEETATRVGHDPGTLKKDYLVPSFEENYLEHGRIGAKNSASAADKENSYMVSRTAQHIDRMLAIRKLAKKDKKKQWEQDSAMLAIMAPPGVIRKLKKVVDDETVSPDGLHVTLLFLGKTADLDDATMKAIQRTAEKVCARHQPLAMRVSGAGRFAPGDDGTPVYVVPNAKGLSTLQADLENAISSIIDLPSEHGWVPHMTVGYACDDNPKLPEMKSYPEWTAKTVRLQAGGKAVADLPLGRKKKADVGFPLSRRAEEEEDDRFRNWAPPGEEREPNPWKQYDDPVKHQREDRPTITMPWNIPDMQVIWAEGLEGEQKVPMDEGLEESDPGGKYVVQDIADRELARYNTAEKAIKNAEKSGWSWRVVFIGPYDDIDTAIVEGPEKVSIPWSRSRKEVERMLEEAIGGPYYLKDYWGRTVASFSDREKAIENAERNMYISHVVGSVTGEPDRGELIWEKPKSGGRAQMADDITDEEPVYVGPLEQQTEKNDYFRQVLFTGNHSQLVLMTLQPGEDIGEEVHKDTDQFFRIDEGEGKAVLDGVEYPIKDGSGVLVPSGTHHNIVNTGQGPLKLYTVYSPPHHGHGEIRKTKEDAQEAEKRDEEAQAAMDRLPIAADPVLWSDEQLAEVVKTPHLMEQLKQQPELLRAVMEQIAKRKGAHETLTPKDIGDWREQGWFLLHGADWPLGWYRSSEDAQLARKRLVDMFAKGNDPPFFIGSVKVSPGALQKTVGDKFFGPGMRPGQGQLYSEPQWKYDTWREETEKDAKEAAEILRSHPFYEGARRRLAEKKYRVLKAPQGFVPDKEAIVDGALPTADNGEAAAEQLSSRNTPEASDIVTEVLKNGIEGHKAEDEFYEPEAGKIAKRLRMKREGIDPDKMADDMPLSQRAMDRLPISADPVLWSDEQISEVLKTPALYEELKKQPELLRAVLEQAAKRKATREGLQPKDIGDWREQGWFLLQGMDWPLGWYRSSEDAQLARKRLVDMFAKGSDAPFSLGSPEVSAGTLQRAIADKFFGPDWKPEELPRHDAQQQYDKLREETQKDADVAAENLRSHPFYEEARRRMAEKHYEVVKAPQGFVPDKEAVVDGAFPTDDTIEATSEQLNKDTPENRRINTEFWRNAEEAMDGEQEFYEGEANKAAKRLRMKREGIDPDKMADDMPKIAGFVGRMICLAERLDDAGDHDGAERLCRQLDLLISRRAHFVPSDKTKAPPMWRKNLDYGEDSPYYGSVKDFLKKYPGGLGEYIKKRRKSRKKRERKWKLSALAKQDDLERAVMDQWHQNEMENDLEDAMEAVAARHTSLRIARMMKLRQLWKISQMESEEGGEEELQEIRDDYIKDPKKAPREFVKYWSILLKDLRKKRKKKGKGK